MAKSKKALHDEIRAKFMESFRNAFGDSEEVLQVKSNEFAIPTLDSEGNEEWIVITFKVPTGTRDGEPYDGYDEAEGYKESVAEKAFKAQEAAEKKAKKIARDKAEREAKAAARAAKKEKA